MKFFPIITATVVVAVLYVLIMQRDLLFGVAGVETEAAVQETVAKPEEKTDQKPAIRVVTVNSTAAVIDSAVVLRGETQAARQVNVMAETAGAVISEPLRKGAFVEKGQILCQIDPGTREASLAEAQARLAEAKARVPAVEAQLEEAEISINAAKKLSKDGFASDTRVASAKAAYQGVKSSVESAQAGIQSAEAAVAAATREIERLTVKAPFAGLLETDTAELGSFLSPGGNGHCATIIQLDPIRIVAFVPETEVNRVQIGAPAMARLAAGGGQIVGQVTFLSRSADPATRTFRVEIEVPNADMALRDGQTAEILISSAGTKAHLLPQSALTLNDQGLLGVRIVDAANKALFVPVTMVRDSKDGVWLTGLDETTQVIVVGQEYVVDGVPVEAVLKEDTK